MSSSNDGEIDYNSPEYKALYEQMVLEEMEKMENYFRNEVKSDDYDYEADDGRSHHSFEPKTSQPSARYDVFKDFKLN